MKWFLDRENKKGEFEKYKFKSIKEINDFDESGGRGNAQPRQQNIFNDKKYSI